MDTPALALSIVFFSLSLVLLFVCAVMFRMMGRWMEILKRARAVR